MALARLCMKNFHQRVFFSPHYIASTRSWESKLGWFSTASASSENVSSNQSDSKDVEVSTRSEKSKLSPRKRRGKLWGRGREMAPFGLNVQMSESLNKFFEHLTPSRLLGLMKEDETAYKMDYLMIRGQHKEEQEDSSDDDEWYAGIYGYYNTSFLLPEDAKVQEIKAELKDGILTLTIPRSEIKKKDVKEVEIK
ncbi:heat shock protein, mitochondrial-like protein [Cinnamomum micranthum f. kanehirae]|uniref:Heat shock protein, mitochondrial-like protein n=1 Tax=Cinnamomum micranthum f. kanehirae TaxID=337451 RepID=A0A3S3Q2F3_9MAGN|nr:heat shock protein, mitochondrial-like protein [Cinnamomum micranthum f. kanehirae]